MKRVRTTEWMTQHLTKLGCTRDQIERHVKAMTKAPAAAPPVRKERRDQGDAIDSDTARDILGVARIEFAHLTDSPAFPSPIVNTRYEVRWSRKEIETFKTKIDDVRRRGWKVDALFKWEFDRPVSWAERRARYANRATGDLRRHGRTRG
jgi:hypothetical protein